MLLVAVTHIKRTSEMHAETDTLLFYSIQKSTEAGYPLPLHYIAFQSPSSSLRSGLHRVGCREET